MPSDRARAPSGERRRDGADVTSSPFLRRRNWFCGILRTIVGGQTWFSVPSDRARASSGEETSASAVSARFGGVEGKDNYPSYRSPPHPSRTINKGSTPCRSIRETRNKNQILTTLRRCFVTAPPSRGEMTSARPTFDLRSSRRAVAVPLNVSRQTPLGAAAFAHRDAPSVVNAVD